MNFEQELVSFLSAAPGVVALVNDRIWPVTIRLNPEFPAITYARESGERQYSLRGDVVQHQVVLRVHCWAADYATARALAELVTVALDGNVGSTTAVHSVRDAADVWLDYHAVYGCAVSVEMILR